jgi:hypothetical protein
MIIAGGTLADPSASFVFGGRIFWNGELTLNRVTVVGNTATAASEVSAVTSAVR